TTDEKVYWNIHAHPANKSDRIFNSPTDTQLSVLLLGIDSLSYSMFRRRMPLTNDYIVNNMGMHMFKKTPASAEQKKSITLSRNSEQCFKMVQKKKKNMKSRSRDHMEKII
uniref:Uncharacterized protein n=1 Tax=Romanomermis culicivorax TaxID=13658 RepID=A0A915HFL5_ROMCU